MLAERGVQVHGNPEHLLRREVLSPLGKRGYRSTGSAEGTCSIGAGNPAARRREDFREDTGYLSSPPDRDLLWGSMVIP